MFEECYRELLCDKPKYDALRERFPARCFGKVHNGYFSQDKKGKY
jgi:hypothetical protein